MSNDFGSGVSVYPFKRKQESLIRKVTEAIARSCKAMLGCVSGFHNAMSVLRSSIVTNHCYVRIKLH